MRVRDVLRLYVALLSYFVLFFAGCQRNGEKADIVLKNGTFYTLNWVQPFVQAVAIKKDHILAVGGSEEMDGLVGDRTRVIDLKGMFGCPGFNDAHVHLLRGGLSRTEVDLTGVRSVEEIQRRVLQRVNELPPGSWVVGRGWDESLFPGHDWPTSRIFERIAWFAPDIPIFLIRVCGHAALVNERALLIASITEETPDPAGGEIVRDPVTRKPTGILKEEAMALVSQYLPLPSEEDIKTAIEEVFDALRRMGITSVQDHGPVSMFEVYQDLMDERKLTCRVALSPPLQEDLGAYSELRQRFNGNLLRFGFLSGRIDGSLGSRTAFLSQAYFDEPSTQGILHMTKEELNRLVILADKEGFQVGMDAVGDGGNRYVLEAYSLARLYNGTANSRHRVEHAQVLTQELVSRFKESGVVASMQPAHCADDMRWCERRIGAQRCSHVHAWKSLKDGGVVLAFGTDWPVVPLDPMIGLYVAVTRRDTLGFPAAGWYPQERLSIEEALEAYTLGSAYAEFMEREKGSLEPGKLADIVVMDRNLLEASPVDILKSKVVYTMLGGRIVYEREE